MKIAVLGARGLIGKNLLRILEEEEVKCELDCFGSLDGVEVSLGNKILPVRKLESFEPEQYDLIFSAVDANLINPFKSRIKKSGAIWVDKSSATRMDSDVPLVVPEVNGDKLNSVKVVASPNCVAIPVAIFLHAIREFGPTFVNVVTYQSVSGAGSKAMSAFFKEIKFSNMQALKHGMYYDDPMAFNVIPAIGEFEEHGNCDEEIKIVQELHKILDTDELSMQIIASVARVPVTVGHMATITFRLNENCNMQRMMKAIGDVGIVYLPGMATPLIAAQEDSVFACRLRKHENNMWSITLVCDNLRKGGALNAWQIAKKILSDKI